MNITDSVIIGGINYKVIKCDMPCEADYSIDGVILFSIQQIRIRDGQGKEYTENTFLHEMVHGILGFINLEQNEDFVERFSNALYQVIKDNPKIFENKEE